MTGKVTTKTQEDAPHGMGGWAALLLEGVSASIQGMLENLQQGTQAFIEKLMRRAGLLVFSLLGVVFLLVGGARLLDGVYQPGVGEIIVGASVLSVALLLYLFFNQKDN